MEPVVETDSKATTDVPTAAGEIIPVPKPNENLQFSDFELPPTCVTRVIKAVIPDNVQVSKDAKNALGRAAGIFVLYLTHCSNDIAQENKRSTIQPNDVFAALNDLEFSNFIDPLRTYLEEYKKETEEKKAIKASHKLAAAEASSAQSMALADDDDALDDLST